MPRVTMEEGSGQPDVFTCTSASQSDRGFHDTAVKLTQHADALRLHEHGHDWKGHVCKLHVCWRTLARPKAFALT